MTWERLLPGHRTNSEHSAHCFCSSSTVCGAALGTWSLAPAAGTQTAGTLVIEAAAAGTEAAAAGTLVTEAAAEVEYLGTVVRAMSRLLLVGVGGQFYKVESGNIEYDECCTPYLKKMGNLTGVSI